MINLNEKEFNLLDEPWIRVIDNQCRVSEVSLTDVIVNAHEYRSLSGEIPTQDIAVMRVILAILHTVFSRVDTDGEDSPLEYEDDDDNDDYQQEKINEALKRWRTLWNMKRFPEEPIKDYLEKWHERFWLFHPEYPFWQVAGLNIGTEYGASKLNGELLESSNKVRMFSTYFGEEKESLSYPQAARWLIYTNAFDDTSSKPLKENKGKYDNADGKAPSVGAGWLGKLGLIYLTGNDLFETLMLNLVMVSGDTNNNQKPIWENENIPSTESRILFEERRKIPNPGNLAELYTLQSRRIILDHVEEKVTGYRLLGGDFFDKENAFFEPMTVWRTPKQSKKKDKEPYTPKRHDSSKQMWREFATLYNEDENRRAGVIEWFRNCRSKGLIKADMIKTSIVSVEYGDKDFFVKNVFSDSLSMNAELITEVGRNYLSDIESEIQKCDKLAFEIGLLAKNLYIASGGDGHEKDYIINDAKSQLYYRLDLPFRKWLAKINPNDWDNKQKTIDEWQKTAQKIATDYANDLISAVPETAFVGHMVKSSKKSKDENAKEIVSAPRAKIYFNAGVKKIYSKI